jgi:uncharacterized LabA/DUF88 family protein
VPVSDRVAILLDGEFVKKALGARLKRFPGHADVMAEVARVLASPCLAAYSLYRVFYYTAEPLCRTAVHPLDATVIDFAKTSVFRLNTRLIDAMEHEPDVAVRRGTLAHQGWEIGGAAIAELLSRRKTTIVPKDVIPKVQQKGVDMRIGLDIASLALKRLVAAIVVVSGDADLVPAMKLARREGLRVFLDTLGRTSVRSELKVHADRVL